MTINKYHLVKQEGVLFCLLQIIKYVRSCAAEPYDAGPETCFTLNDTSRDCRQAQH